jgi:pSer/pThr/pTyr-binding forkhead associated (FHA) protein
MLAPVSVGLKFGFLIVLYLFLVWVTWSALRDLRRGREGVVRPDQAAPYDATGMYPASSEFGEPNGDGFEPRLLVEHAPGHETGSSYEIPSHGATLGRGDVEIRLDDPFASAHHARVSREGHVVVIEDLGSTNGTYLNEQQLNGPQPLHPGDRIRIGDCEFSYEQ